MWPRKGEERIEEATARSCEQSHSTITTKKTKPIAQVPPVHTKCGGRSVHESSRKVRRHSVTPPSATSSGKMNLINSSNCKHILQSQNHTNRTVSDRRILDTHHLLSGCKYPDWQPARRIHQCLSLALLLLLHRTLLHF